VGRVCGVSTCGRVCGWAAPGAYHR